MSSQAGDKALLGRADGGAATTAPVVDAYGGAGGPVAGRSGSGRHEGRCAA